MQAELENLPEPERSEKYIANPEQWICFSIPALCPLKRGDIMKDGNLGFLIEGAGFTVFIGNMYELAEKPPKDFSRKEYPSVQAITADGWRVD